MDYRTLPYDELRTLYQNLGALLAERRAEALQQLKDQAVSLGVDLRELIPRKTRKRRAAREEDN